VLNKKPEVIKILLQSYPDIDVMKAPSEYAKSAVDMAFAGNDTAVMQLILEHKTAAPLDRLADEFDAKLGKKGESKDDDDEEEDLVISAGDVADEKEKEEEKKGQTKPKSKTSTETKTSKVTTSNEPAEVTHEFKWAKSAPVLKIRELGMSKEVFGKDSSEDSTGLSVWASAVVFARWITEQKDRFTNKSVLELGAGCGLPGITALRCTKASRVVLSDLHKPTINNLKHNLALNIVKEDGNKANADVQVVDWTNKLTWPREKFDVLLLCDLIYSAELVPHLLNIVKTTLKPNGSLMMVAKKSEQDRQGLDDFIAALQDPAKGPGFVHCQSKWAPEAYLANPLHNQPQEAAILYFNELLSSEFGLHYFSFVKPRSRAKKPKPASGSESAEI